MLAGPSSVAPVPPTAARKIAGPALAKAFLAATPAGIATELSRYIVPRGPVVLIHDPVIPDLQTFVLPRGSSWEISCGIGLSVSFGSSISGGGNDIGNDVELQLDNAMLTKTDCEKIGIKLGVALAAMVGLPSTTVHNP